MTRPSINFSDLPPEVQEQMRPTKRKAAKTAKPRDASAIARKRGRTGSGFEAELNMSHRMYEFQKVGKLWPHSPPFVRTKKEGWLPRAGGAHVDRTGHVYVTVERDSGPFGRDNAEVWKAAPFTDPRARCVPVAFDAKVLGVEHATYQHEHKAQHQLLQLRDAAEAGVAAFLLVHAPKHDRVFLIPILNHFTDLVSGRGVTLWDVARAPVVRDVFPLLPSIRRSAPVVWDWIPLLQWCTTRRDSP